jgi:ubiquinone/menaquinone biosynthesis C-methylase UbiE
MVPPQRLVSLLRDPLDSGDLRADGDALLNPATGKRYPIFDGIPVFVEAAGLGPLNSRYRKMYDRLSFGYDASLWLGDLLYFGKISKLRRTIAAALGLRPGLRCLYTSIGTGADVPFLIERVPLQSIDFVGLDLSMGMLKRCRKRLGGFADTSLLMQANAERLPFADASFDVVLHVGGINFFDHPDAAVREMLRVAKPGAVLVVSDETKKVVKTSYKRNPFTRGYFKDAAMDFNPRSWVPESAVAVTYDEVWGGRGYILAFRAPGG